MMNDPIALILLALLAPMVAFLLIEILRIAIVASRQRVVSPNSRLAPISGE